MLDRFFHYILIQAAVRLHALGMHGRAFALVQHPVLKRHFVRRAPHFSAERVDLKDELTFSRTADGWIARHIRNGVVRYGEKDRFATEARRRERGLNSGVSRADNGDVNIVDEVVHNLYTFFV